MRAFLLCGVLAIAALGRPASAQTEQQALVDRATLTVQEIMGDADGSNPQSTLRKAVGVMVCPQIFKAAFFLGGSGGTCVLATRDGSGTWSYPAFYGMGSGSAGLQFGVQDSETMMMIMTRKGLTAVMDDQFRFGGDASVAVATLGGGLEGATTSALGADIVIVGKARGLFAGISLQGSSMSTKTDWNRKYYGRDLAARQVVIDMEVRNPGADPLRETLTKFGGKGPRGKDAATPAAAPANAPSAAPLAPITSQPLAPIRQQTLPPPRR